MLVGTLLTPSVYAMNSKAFKDSKVNSIYNNAKFNRSVDYQETDSYIIDLTPVKEKSTKRKPLKSNKTFSILSETPTNTSSIKYYDPIIEDNYALAKSSSTVVEDYIYVKARVYNYKGVLLGDKEAEMNYTSFLSAKAYGDSALGGTAYGNHVYRLAGYKDVIHETTTDFI